jgi:uncharacterized protein (DUF4415 family)
MKPKTKTPRAPRGYTKTDEAAVADNPRWTKSEFAKARPFSDAFPDLDKTIRRRGPQKAPTKQPVSLRLSRDVIDHYKAKGPGWQARIDDDLRKVAKLRSARS